MSPSPAALEPALSPVADGSALRVKVVPNARRSRIAGMLGDRLKVQVAAPPEAGQANEALCALLADALGVKRAAVAVTLGQTQPRKTETIAALAPGEVARRLAEA